MPYKLQKATSKDTLSRLISLGNESEELDYKEIYLPESKGSTFEIAKDIMAMSNTEGGHMVFGVTDDGKSVGYPEGFTIDSATFYMKMIRCFKPKIKFRYVEHYLELEGSKKKYGLVYIEPSKEVVVANITGNYTDEKGRQKTAFRTGDVYVRKGSSSERADDEDMRLLLSKLVSRRSLDLDPIDRELIGTDFQNIPRPPYVEFVGRLDYIDDILLKLAGRHFLVSIDGIGGVGKTALAHAIASRCLEEELFDAVVWISAKSKRLTLMGIDDIVPSLTSYEDLLNTIVNVLGMPMLTDLPLEEKEEAVRDLISNVNSLMIVDNLESVDDERVFEFLKNLPEPSKALITSRRRLGEVEKVVRLESMPAEETRQLTLHIAKDKKAKEVLDANRTTLDRLFEITGGIPLAIELVVSMVSTGYRLETALHKLSGKGSHILEFCFSEAYQNHLSSTARKILTLMPIFEGDVTSIQIAAATGLKAEQLEEALAQLVQLSLLNEETTQEKDGSLNIVYSVLPLTLAFALEELSQNRALEKEARKRYGAFHQREHRVEQALVQYGHALEDLGASTTQGRTAAVLANLAFAAYQRGNYDDAQGIFKQAVEASPRLSYVYQLWATVERQESNYSGANELFKEAARLNPRNPIILRSWAMMKRDSGEIVEAKRLLNRALKGNPQDRRARHSLGVVESQLGQYKRALDLFDQTMHDNPSSSEEIRMNLVCYGAKAETFRKWGMDEQRKKQLGIAEAKYCRALEIISKGYKLNAYEWKLRDIELRVKFLLGSLLRRLREYDAAITLLEDAFYPNPRGKFETKQNSEAYFQLILAYKRSDNPEKALEICREIPRKFVTKKLARIENELEAICIQDN